MKYLIWSLAALLVVLNQDYWQWEDNSLVLGFLPYTLAYHVGLSIAAAVVWLAATQFCWPQDIEEADDAAAGDEGPQA